MLSSGELLALVASADEDSLRSALEGVVLDHAHIHLVPCGIECPLPVIEKVLTPSAELTVEDQVLLSLSGIDANGEDNA